MPARYHKDILPVWGKKIRFRMDGNPVDVIPLLIEEGPHTWSEWFDVFFNSAWSGISWFAWSFNQATGILNYTISGTFWSIPANVTIPDASITSRWLVNTTTQSFAGNKTFTWNVTVNWITQLWDNITDYTSVTWDLIVQNRFRTANSLQLPTSAANSTTNLIAASTVDITSYIQINQTNTGATYVLPNPTAATRWIHLWISNTGSAAFQINGNIINPQSTIHLVYDWSVWSENEASRNDSFIVVTATWPIPTTVDTVFVNNWATAITITMPAKVTGKCITISRGIWSTWWITINPWGWQIEALANTLVATTTLAAWWSLWSSVMFITDWTNWLRKNNG